VPVGLILRYTKLVHVGHILFKIISEVSLYLCHNLEGSLFLLCVLTKIFYMWFMTQHFHLLFYSTVHSPVKLQGSWNIFSYLNYSGNCEIWCEYATPVVLIGSQDGVWNTVGIYHHFMLFFIRRRTHCPLSGSLFCGGRVIKQCPQFLSTVHGAASKSTGSCPERSGYSYWT
jgi:hypothetical protein